VPSVAYRKERRRSARSHRDPPGAGHLWRHRSSVENHRPPVLAWPAVDQTTCPSGLRIRRAEQPPVELRPTRAQVRACSCKTYPPPARRRLRFQAIRRSLARKGPQYRQGLPLRFLRPFVSELRDSGGLFRWRAGRPPALSRIALVATDRSRTGMARAGRCTSRIRRSPVRRPREAAQKQRSSASTCA
jgi:hypothetical protein